ELEKLRGTLSTINAVLLDAEEKQESSHTLKNWMSQPEDVVYYAILRQKVLARRQVPKFFSSSSPLAFGLKMGPRIKEFTERLDSVAADISKFNLSPRVVKDMKAKHTDTTTASKVRPEMIGREKDKKHIIESLFQEQNDRHGDNIFNIVAIVGFGGLGKTILAQLVYNDAEVENFFNPRSKILMTARSKKVATIMGVNHPYLLECLNEDQSCALFEKVAFAGQCQTNPKLREIGQDVARRYKGVPLAIKCLGSLMRQKLNEKYWLSVQENEI
ncbi:NB-ARC - like 10, partial [Theobroma cacao]